MHYDLGEHCEHLYDLQEDPDELKNVSNDPKYNEVLEQHRKLFAQESRTVSR